LYITFPSGDDWMQAPIPLINSRSIQSPYRASPVKHIRRLANLNAAQEPQ